MLTGTKIYKGKISESSKPRSQALSSLLPFSVWSRDHPESGK